MAAVTITNKKEDGKLYIEGQETFKTWEVIRFLEEEGSFWNLDIIAPNVEGKKGYYSVKYLDPRSEERLNRKIIDANKKRGEKQPMIIPRLTFYGTGQENEIEEKNIVQTIARNSTETIAIDKEDTVIQKEEDGKGIEKQADKEKSQNNDRAKSRIACLMPKWINEDDVITEFGRYGPIDYIKTIKAREPGKKVALIKYLWQRHTDRALRKSNFKCRKANDVKGWLYREFKMHRTCGKLVTMPTFDIHRNICRRQAHINKKSGWDKKEKDDQDEQEEEKKLIIDEDGEFDREIEELKKLLW